MVVFDRFLEPYPLQNRMILIWLTIRAAKLKSVHKFHYILKFLFWTSFVAINILALSPASYLPALEIFKWWDKVQHTIAFYA